MRKRIAAMLMIIVVLLAGTGAEATQAQEGVLGYHVVRPGETLYCIARAYGVSPWEIALRNHLINVNLLHAGDRLAIPAAPISIAQGPVCQAQFFSPYTGGCRIPYTIRPGDTLSAIGRRYGVDIWTLAHYNGIFNLNVIRAGATLCIP